MDASKFYTTNAEEWYPNMLECGDCETETEAGTLADMLQWAMDHSKVCDPGWFMMESWSEHTGDWYSVNGGVAVRFKDIPYWRDDICAGREFRFTEVEK